MLCQSALGQVSTWADRVGQYLPEVPGAEFGLGVRWRLALTSICKSKLKDIIILGSQMSNQRGPLAFHRWWFFTLGVVACHGVALLLRSSVAHRFVPG